jgi:hypothetical protein
VFAGRGIVDDCNNIQTYLTRRISLQKYLLLNAYAFSLNQSAGVLSGSLRGALVLEDASFTPKEAGAQIFVGIKCRGRERR